MDIFEQYGFYAKNYDALNTMGAQRTLTAKEKNFCDTFTDMLHGDKTEADMKKAWKEWIEEFSRGLYKP